MADKREKTFVVDGKYTITRKYHHAGRPLVNYEVTDLETGDMETMSASKFKKWIGSDRSEERRERWSNGRYPAREQR